MPIEVSAHNFQASVIDASSRAPVLVDFWAPWCAPCRALTPVLEKLEAEYEGRFTLAKVNSDENAQLAAQYGVRGIPNVKAFAGGQVVDEFSGALPERLVREFLDRVIPSEADKLAHQAEVHYRETGDGPQALALAEQALQKKPENTRALKLAAGLLTELGRFDEARACLDRLAPLAQMDESVSALRARLDFAASAAATPGADALLQRIERDPNDLDARLALANLQAAKGDYAAALDQLLDIVRRNRAFGDDIARKTMLQIFNVLGNQSDIVSEYRRRLASAMY